LKVLLIDFYDSFTFNIFHYLEGLGVDVTVCEDKALVLDEIEAFDCIILSPGPGLPNETQSMFAVLERYSSSKKILGVCLGMQGVAEFFGATLYNQNSVKHGISERMTILQPNRLFRNFKNEISVGLYHSWAVDLNKGQSLIPIGFSENNILMAYEHATLPIFGVQFHPESILTENGKEVFKNFLFSC
jgi:anthranilate synthase component 2